MFSNTEHLTLVFRVSKIHITENSKHKKNVYNKKSLSLTPILQPPKREKQIPLKYNQGVYTPNCFLWNHRHGNAFPNTRNNIFFLNRDYVKFTKQKTSG